MLDQQMHFFQKDIYSELSTRCVGDLNFENIGIVKIDVLRAVVIG